MKNNHYLKYVFFLEQRMVFIAYYAHYDLKGRLPGRLAILYNIKGKLSEKLRKPLINH